LGRGKTMRLLVTGCPRSGTTYTSRFFKKCGKDVPHEAEGKDGIVSWLLTPTIPEGSTMKQYRNFKLIRQNGKSYSMKRPYHTESPIPTYEYKQQFKQIHQIREPQNCISSMSSIRDMAFIWTHGFIDYPPVIGEDITKQERLDYNIIQRMYFWYYWNKIGIENSVWHYRIESLNEEKERFCQECNVTGKDFDKAYGDVSKTTNKRKHGIVSWEKMESLDKDMFEKIQVFARSLGYS
jgi:hypothetical protein